MEFSGTNFNEIYKILVENIKTHGKVRTTRKKETIRALHNVSFSLEDPRVCWAPVRNPSMEYLEKEFRWYIGGSLRLADAAECSAFWKKCTDDGSTVNSNYGYLLLHETNEMGCTQFEHALTCLQNNPESKKAVMTVYSQRHSYLSNDNPCTMFVQLSIQDGELNMDVHMRSSDIFFGLPYDVPWFCFVQYAALRVLRQIYPELILGTYTHHSTFLQMYDRDLDKLDFTKAPEKWVYMDEFFAQAYKNLKGTLTLFPFLQKLMQKAEQESQKSSCLKKKVGATLWTPSRVYVGNGSRMKDHYTQETCKVCARDQKEKFYSDGCFSVHAEMKCILEATKEGILPREREVVMVCTHGPCDACMKLMHYMGIDMVYYKHEYKTAYAAHWPNMTVRKLLEL